MRFNERAVVSDEVVSTRKEARSAHVEISKMDRFRKREGKKGQRPKPRRPPIIPRGEHVRGSIFKFYNASTCLSVSLVLSSLALPHTDISDITETLLR